MDAFQGTTMDSVSNHERIGVVRTAIQTCDYCSTLYFRSYYTETVEVSLPIIKSKR